MIGSNMLKDLSVSVVVPTYQEVQNLRPLVGRISRAMSKANRPMKSSLSMTTAGMERTERSKNCVSSDTRFGS